MIRNYFLVAWRNLTSQRLYSSINLLGLTIGTAVVILLLAHVRDELTFDQFHPNADRISRAWVKEHADGNVFFNTITPYVLGPVLEDNIPEVESVTRYMTFPVQFKEETQTGQEDVHAVEPSFLRMFGFKLLQGDPDRLLSEPNSIVLTESMARKYFGEPRPIGKTLKVYMDDWSDFRVTGVMADPPVNSSLQFTSLVPLATFKNRLSENGQVSWTNVNVETYVLLKPGADRLAVEKKIQPLMDVQVAKIYDPGKYEVGLQPLTDIHLDDAFPVGFVPVSNPRYPYILGAIGLLILLLAGINFTTLAVGRSMTRAKEVGIRKTTGATRGQLIGQYWVESVLTATIAVIAGFIVARVLLPYFNDLSDKHLDLSLNGNMILFLVALALLTGLLAGIYPAMIVSGFKPIQALQGNNNTGKQQKFGTLRGLVGAQFTISILLIICTWTMSQQLHFLQNKDLGYNHNQLVVIPYLEEKSFIADMFESGKALRQRILTELGSGSGVQDIGVSTNALGTPGWVKLGYTDAQSRQFHQFTTTAIDPHFLPLMEIPLVEGHNFSGAEAADANAVIVNEAFAKEFNVALGQPLPQPFDQFKVTGVAKDFNFESLHEQIHPLVMTTNIRGMLMAASDVSFDDFPNPKLTFKLSAGQIVSTMSRIEKIWKDLVPDQAFQYSFIDDSIDRQYRSERRLGQIVSLATLLALFIACLGLFGIATLTTAQRMKEIGVRKVLGASTGEILVLLNKPLTLIILLATGIAIPVAWYLMQNWLTNFAFRINPSILVMLGAGLGALLLALVAVSWQSFNAARKSPVHSLRNE